MNRQSIGDLKEQTWEEFFEDQTVTWERAYQAFEARREAEKKLKSDYKTSIPCSCKCPISGENFNATWNPQYVSYRCSHLGDDDICTHPSNKPPEPECEHGFTSMVLDTFRSYKSIGDKHCRDCGEKL